MDRPAETAATGRLLGYFAIRTMGILHHVRDGDKNAGFGNTPARAFDVPVIWPDAGDTGLDLPARQ